MSLDITEHNYESIDEPEQAQVHSIYYHLNKVAEVQRIVNTNEPSAKFCIDCEREIPEARRLAVRGCKRCTTCQEEHDLYEKRH